MSYSEEILQSETAFRSSSRHRKTIASSGNRIVHFAFHSEPPHLSGITGENIPKYDRQIRENQYFDYPVILPENARKFHSGIILFHGLNERSWGKYIPWAEFLASHTGKPVILFPIAFHMNRGPAEWSNPRVMAELVTKRKSLPENRGAMSFANAALSQRLTDFPDRFFWSGLQTVSDVTGLVKKIRDGEHPLFHKNADIDLFGYSIGAFLAEIILMANPGNLFSDTRLFIFCGGSIFSQMFGVSKLIMDTPAYNRLLQFYCSEWPAIYGKSISDNLTPDDPLIKAFSAMIRPDYFKTERKSFFAGAKNRISGIALQKDQVMPYSGIKACMGDKTTNECIELIDFPFDYSHEIPFPDHGKIDKKLTREAMNKVLVKGVAFLS